MRIAERTTDPLTGIRTTIGFDNGKMIVKRDQDVAPALDHTTALRNAAEYSARGIKQNMWHCVSIPQAVCLQMMKEDGFDPYTENARDLRKFLARNKAKYGYLFTTAGKF